MCISAECYEALEPAGEGNWSGSEELREACQKGSRAPEVMDRHGGGLVQGGGAPTAVSITDPIIRSREGKAGAGCFLHPHLLVPARK